MERVEIDGNAETVYLPKDDKQVIIGLNRLEGSSLTMFLKEDKLQKLIVWPQPKGRFFPLDKLTSEDRFLRHFAWYETYRPKDKQDVFRKVDLPAFNEQSLAGKEAVDDTGPAVQGSRLPGKEER